MMMNKQKMVSGQAKVAAVCSVLPGVVYMAHRLGLPVPVEAGLLVLLIILVCPLLAVVFGVGAVIKGLRGVRRNPAAVTGVNLMLGGASVVLGGVMCWFAWQVLMAFTFFPVPTELSD